ncbi:MAG: lipid-A-disaccharide synthase [Muribaculaceae bacterium]|nr:lipid-A-disaccharide synthase [Muribaculaceae bacterium]
MEYFIIAGEASGDLHGSRLMEALKRHDAEARFTFLGGDKMALVAGHEPLIHYRDMAYMGFVDVIKHLRPILGFMRTAKRALASNPPAVLILIDYPSFNLKMARYAHDKLHLPVHYFISPKVWAWKQWRVKSIKRWVDRMYSILPFEVEFYRQHDYDVDYVGNPTVNEVKEALAAMGTREDFATTHGLDSRPILVLVPGSRKKEIRDNLPVMLSVAAHHPEVQAVIAGAPSIDESLYRQVMGEYRVPVLRDVTFSLVHHAAAALVTSGTATLETALLGTPQVAMFRMNGSKWVYRFYSRLIKGKYVTLPNLILDADAIPELLLHHCNEENVDSWLTRLLDTEGDARAAMLRSYASLRTALGTNDCAATTASHIIHSIKAGGDEK